MNQPETPIDTLRRKPETRTGPLTEGALPADRFEPRYVDVPRRRRAQLAAERNLKWGLAVLLLSLGLIGAALIVTGPRALVPIVICLVTLTILWAMARLRVFHQRNGVFFATAMVCLLGASVPMIERGYVELDRMAHNSASQSAPIVATAPEAKPAAPQQKNSEPPPVAEFAPDVELPSLVDALKIPDPTDPNASLVRIIENTKIAVGRKAYMLNSGDIFPYVESKDGQVFFKANELRLSVPERAVELMAPSSSAPATVGDFAADNSIAAAPPRTAQTHVADHDLDGAATARAQAEAVRRYPGIGVKDSPENQLFLEEFQKLKRERPEFFDDEQWPIYLAEGVAKKNGWVRAK